MAALREWLAEYWSVVDGVAAAPGDYPGVGQAAQDVGFRSRFQFGERADDVVRSLR